MRMLDGAISKVVFQSVHEEDGDSSTLQATSLSNHNMTKLGISMGAMQAFV